MADESKKPKRNRNVSFFFRATPEEANRILARIEKSGMKDKGAYFRRMAMEGYLIHVELKEIRDLTRAYSRYNNNVNQIARHINQTGSIYKNDLALIRDSQEKMTNQIYQLLKNFEVLIE